MDDKTLSCGKCGTLLEINAAHVTFKGGKKAYIKCPNPKCNNQRRISWDMVEYLKPSSEAVKNNPIIDEKKQDEGGLASDAPAKTAIPEAIEKALSEEEQPVKSPSVEGGKDSEGLGWIIGGIAGLFGLGALIALARR